MRVTDGSTRRFVITHILSVCMLGAVLLLAWICPASAATITVTNLNDSGAGSLRQAITDAVATPDADTINFALSGTITLSSGLPGITAAGGSLTIDGTGHSITISGSLFGVQSGASLILKHLVVSNAAGKAASNAGSLTVDYCILSGNSASDGGAVWNTGTMVMSNSTVANSSVSGSGSGGGIYNETNGTLMISNSTLSGNSVTMLGGGIFNRGSLTITSSIISGNSATGGGSGGGIYNETDGTLSISDSTLSGNRAGYHGGGLYHFSNGAVTILNSTFSGNSSDFGNGGGISAVQGSVSITNSTFSGNSAPDYGGCISSSSSMSILNSTFIGNSAATGGSTIFNRGVNNTAADLRIANTIIANGVGAGNCGSIFGGIISTGHNLDSGNTCGFSGPGDVSNTNPQLGPLALNGPGTTQTHALLAGSPAINAADAASCPSTDQRGIPRPQGAGCDIGAYEREVYREIHTSATAGSGNISCVPYGFTAGTTDIIYYIVDHTDAVCVMTPNVNNHVADVFIGSFPVGILISAGPLWTYGYPDISGNKTIEASFAANHIWLRKGGGLVSTVTTTINDAISQAATADDDEIRIESGAYLEGFGLACSGNFGGIMPILSGGWTAASVSGTKRTVIAPKLTISGSCALEIDKITIQ